MELPDLPTELILMIEERLPTQADVFALMRSHSCMLAILQQRLYARPRGEDIFETFLFAIERENERLASAMLNLVDLIPDSVNTEVGMGALNLAAMSGQLNMVRLVLKHPKTINKPAPTDDENHTAVMDATIFGHTETLKFLLAQPHLHPQKPSLVFFEATLRRIINGITLTECELWDIPINQALYDGNWELVRILLADPRVELNSLSLIAAARGGREDMVRLCLLEYPHQFDPIHESLLIIATRDNNMSLVKLLLKVAGHTSDMKLEIDGKTPSISAANQEIPASDNPLLARNNISVKTTDRDGKSPFIYSTIHGNVKMMKMLLGTGEVNVDSTDRLGRTPLSYAVGQAKKQVVKFLLSLDAVDPGLKDYYCMVSPLHYAVYCCDVAVMKLLLNTGKVNVNSLDMERRTPLSFAAEQAGKRAVKLLLLFDADPGLRDCYGMTPLHYAAKCGDVAVMKVLLNTGKVDVNSCNKEGQTPLSLATEIQGNRKEAAVQFLISLSQESQCPKAVAFCCKKRCCKVVKKLLKWIR